MLIKNMDEGVLANGTMGRVIDFVDPTTHAGGAALDKNDKTKPKPSAGEKWPIVQFVLADGSQREMLMARESWYVFPPRSQRRSSLSYRKVELPNGEIQVSRSQVSFSGTHFSIVYSPFPVPVDSRVGYEYRE